MPRTAITVFIEYRMNPQMRSDFFAHFSAVREAMQRTGNVLSHELMEGIDQPALMVEVIQVEDMDTYEKLKVMRQSEDGAMGELAKTIVGGSSKVNVWAFQLVDS